MSRSYKKHPIIKDGGKSKKIGKKYANRKVRRAKDLVDGCMYKNVFCRYDICDVIIRWTYKEHLADVLAEYKQYRMGTLKYGCIVRTNPLWEETSTYAWWRKTYLGK